MKTETAPTEQTHSSAADRRRRPLIKLYHCPSLGRPYTEDELVSTFVFINALPTTPMSEFHLTFLRALAAEYFDHTATNVATEEQLVERWNKLCGHHAGHVPVTLTDVQYHLDMMFTGQALIIGQLEVERDQANGCLKLEQNFKNWQRVMEFVERFPKEAE